jgi:hypothetical protein
LFLALVSIGGGGVVWLEGVLIWE